MVTDLCIIFHGHFCVYSRFENGCLVVDREAISEARARQIIAEYEGDDDDDGNDTAVVSGFRAGPGDCQTWTAEIREVAHGTQTA